MPHGSRHALALAASLAGLLLAPQAPHVYAELSGSVGHVVQPGETLWQIAQTVGVDSATLVRLNELTNPDLIVAGQTLKLPATTNATAPAPATPAAAPGTYVVAAGDTLWTIALRFSTTPGALASANHLDNPDLLSIGTQLSLPGAPVAAAAPAAQPASSAPNPGTQATSYTVQQGETLHHIAHAFGVSMDTIAQASGLEDSNKLSIGMVLKIPVPGRGHVVQADERLRDIAAQEKVDLGALIDFNNIDDPELIHPGQVVMIPPAGQQAASISQPAAVPVPAPAQATGQHSAPPARANDQQSAAPAPQPGPAASKPGSDNSLAALGVKFVGTRYIWGGSSPSGFDCSGLVWYVARQAGKPISRGMLGQYNSGPHPGRNELKPGDMVFFQNTYTPGLSHNGMYLGNGQFVHAADERDGVTISSLSAPYWAAHWFGATRLP